MLATIWKMPDILKIKTMSSGKPCPERLVWILGVQNWIPSVQDWVFLNAWS